MTTRDKIIERAEYWASPGDWKPGASDLIEFFEKAGCEQVPSLADASRSLSLPNGVYIGKAIKHWCGIWACAVMVEAGLQVRWTLMSGTIKTKSGAGLTKVWGYRGIQRGDIAVINQASHHFIVTAVNGSSVDSIDGNSSQNMIRTLTGKPISSIVAYYRVNE